MSITDGERISEFVDRAWKIALSGYPGAVHLSLPVDIMFSSFEESAMRDERPFDRGAGRPARAWPCPPDLEQALDDFYSVVDHHFGSGKLGGLRLCARRLD